jgi:hypothetical protein
MIYNSPPYLTNVDTDGKKKKHVPLSMTIKKSKKCTFGIYVILSALYHKTQRNDLLFIYLFIFILQNHHFPAHANNN